jgi:hypothetical protein
LQFRRRLGLSSMVSNLTNRHSAHLLNGFSSRRFLFRHSFRFDHDPETIRVRVRCRSPARICKYLGRHSPTSDGPGSSPDFRCPSATACRGRGLCRVITCSSRVTLDRKRSQTGCLERRKSHDLAESSQPAHFVQATPSPEVARIHFGLNPYLLWVELPPTCDPIRTGFGENPHLLLDAVARTCVGGGEVTG